MTIVVTGGAGRIGSAIVQLLCERGHQVVVQYRKSANQAELLQKQWPHLVSLFQCDLLLPNELDRFIDFLKQQGQLHGLINNAGVFIKNPISDNWQQEMEVVQLQLNTIIPLRLCHALRNQLQDSNGSIVNVVDNVSGSKPWPNHSGYAASKAGLLAITRSLAVELAPYIRVNAVGPGLILETEQDSKEWGHLIGKIPMRRSGTPEEVAETILFLMFGPAYITGQILCIDGGWGLSP
jgi:pteridine reductase